MGELDITLTPFTLAVVAEPGPIVELSLLDECAAVTFGIGMVKLNGYFASGDIMTVLLCAPRVDGAILREHVASCVGASVGFLLVWPEVNDFFGLTHQSVDLQQSQPKLTIDSLNRRSNDNKSNQNYDNMRRAIEKIIILAICVPPYSAHFCCLLLSSVCVSVYD